MDQHDGKLCVGVAGIIPISWFNAAMQEVPLLSPCPPAPPAPPPMLSKNVGGKFKYLNRKNSEF